MYIAGDVVSVVGSSINVVASEGDSSAESVYSAEIYVDASKDEASIGKSGPGAGGAAESNSGSASAEADSVCSGNDSSVSGAAAAEGYSADWEVAVSSK